jgi:class 3 adenylate cyclase/predicted ATPase
VEGEVDIPAWLRGLGLEQYQSAFQENDIDGGVLLTLTDADLRELGVASLGHRRKLLAAIALRGQPIGTANAGTGALGATSAAPVQREVASPSAHAERRQLTIMFVDMVGSTALSEQLDPEDMRDLLAAYRHAVASDVTRWEGHIARFMGDGVLAYFGWPRAHEDVAERAVRAGLAIVESVRGVRGPQGISLSSRVGIATGLVVVGELIGEGASLEEAVVGATPNLAARLQQMAPADAVLIAESTRHLLGNLFALLDLGVQSIKGIEAPVHAFRALGEGSAESRFEALHGASLTPLIGRDYELAFLLELFTRAKEGEGQVVLLSGEAGIGKSRLVSALREQVREQPLITLSHFCSPYHKNSALYPIIGLLERAAELRRDEPPAQQLDKIERLLALATEGAHEDAPLIADLLGVSAGERYPPLNLTPQEKKEKTLEVLMRQFAALAAQRPVLALYEDAHWADPSTLELLGTIVDAVQRLPALVVITYHPEFLPPWIGRAHVTSLALNRLSQQQVTSIIGQVASAKALPAEICEQILAKADGVPLFAEELTKAMLESGFLEEQKHQFVLKGPLPPLAVPDTLQASLMARLDRLAPVKEIAQIGAVLGREFSHELLAAIAPLGADILLDALAQLMAAELIFRRGMPPHATYTFKHALVQDAAYDSLLKSRRLQLHAKVAYVLQERFPDSVSNQPELLAHHFTEARLAEQAIVYWRRAGERASGRSANIEAIAHLNKGLELVPGLPDARQAEEELALRIAIAGPLIATKAYSAPEVESAYSRALELCERLKRADDLFPVLRGLWNCYFVRGELPRGRDLAQRLVLLADEQDDPLRRALARRALGSTLVFLGQPADARASLDQGIALGDAADAAGDRRAHVLLYAERPSIVCRLYSAWSYWLLGYPDCALRDSNAALVLSQELGHVHGLAFTLNFIAVVHLWRREFAVAKGRAEAAVAIAREHSLAQWLAMGTMARGVALAGLGQHAEGIAQLHDGFAQWQRIGASLANSKWLGFTAEAHAAAGQISTAFATLDRAADAAAFTGEAFVQSQLLTVRALLHARMGLYAEAEAGLHSAIDIARTQSAKSFLITYNRTP